CLIYFQINTKMFMWGLTTSWDLFELGNLPNASVRYGSSTMLTLLSTMLLVSICCEKFSEVARVLELDYMGQHQDSMLSFLGYIRFASIEKSGLSIIQICGPCILIVGFVIQFSCICYRLMPQPNIHLIVTPFCVAFTAIEV
ncbi:hypothetical protein ACJX0J_035152, partial [Zea mays]